MGGLGYADSHEPPQTEQGYKLINPPWTLVKVVNVLIEINESHVIPAEVRQSLPSCILIT